MKETSESSRKSQGWDWEDTKLLRAARRIIRLYDLEEVTLIKVKPESLARVIAQELNAGDTTTFKKRSSAQKPS